MADFRSCFPSSFDFKQMDTVLKLVRERMDVDSFSRIEKTKETYLNSLLNLDKCCHAPSKKGSFQRQNVVDVLTYDIRNDNEGLGRWLAYQLGLQMMWKQLSDEGGAKSQEHLFSILARPQEAFKANFKYFYEERLWKLAQIEYDPQGFNLVNFNQIVKTTLIRRMAEKSA